MHGAEILPYLIIFVTAAVVLFLCNKIKVPSVIGFLLTGVLIAHNGFWVFADQDFINSLSEIGIILMLFVIGLEFSIDDLLKRKRVTLLGGFLQVGVTIVITAGLALLFDIEPKQALFYAILISLSSTAVVIKLYTDKQMLDSIPGNTSLSLLIFQDVAAVLFIVFLPVFDSGPETKVLPLVFQVLSGIGILIGLFIAARYLIPPILYQILKTRNRELFLLTILAIIIGVTAVSGALGLSVALGAFLAGVVIADSDYSNYTLAHIIPFQDLFTSLFFISIGFLFNPFFLLENPIPILIVLVASLVIKILVIYPVSMLVGLSSKSSLIVAFSLAQVGEFSFILGSLGEKKGVIDEESFQIFVAVTILSMALTPVLIFLAHQIADTRRFRKISLVLDRIASGGSSKQKKVTLRDHLLIIGYGITGKLHANVFEKFSLPYLVIEMNPLTVRHEKKNGRRIVHGDASSPILLDHVNVKKARAAIISVPNHEETIKIIKNLKARNPYLFTIARCRHIFEMEEMMKSGADRTIAVELESALEILSQTMGEYQIAEEEIENNLNDIRRGFAVSSRRALDKTIRLTEIESQFPEIKTLILKVGDHCDLTGKNLVESKMKDSWGVSLLAYKRGDEVTSNPKWHYRFQSGDHIMVFGTHQNLIDFAKFNEFEK